MKFSHDERKRFVTVSDILYRVNASERVKAMWRVNTDEPCDASTVLAAITVLDNLIHSPATRDATRKTSVLFAARSSLHDAMATMCPPQCRAREVTVIRLDDRTSRVLRGVARELDDTARTYRDDLNYVAEHGVSVDHLNRAVGTESGLAHYIDHAGEDTDAASVQAARYALADVHRAMLRVEV